jgi:hypothetical protein
MYADALLLLFELTDGKMSVSSWRPLAGRRR